MISSNQTQDPQGPDPAKITHNLKLMTDANWSEGEKRTWLEGQGVNPNDYLDAGPSVLQRIGRGAGLAGRAVVQGLGAASDIMPWNAPQRIAGQIAGIPAQAPTGQRGADQIGLPRPETPGERTGVAAGEGAIMGALSGGGPLGTLLGAASGTAGQAAKESGAGPLGQAGASVAVGLGVPAMGKIAAGAIRIAFAGTAARRTEARAALDLIQGGDPDAAVSLGQVAGGIAPTVQGGLRNTPTAISRFRKSFDEQAENMRGQMGQIADRVTGRKATPEAAGRVVQRGIEDGFIPRFRGMANELYGKVFAMLPKDFTVQPVNTAKIFIAQGNLAAKARPFSENIATPTLKKWGDDLAQTLDDSPDGSISFEVLKEFRSKIGNMISGTDLVTDVAKGDLKQLYGALSQDMKYAIAQTNPKALPAWNRAQLYWEKGSDRIQNVLQPIMDKKTPEVAFKALFNGSRDGATVLRSTMRSLGPEERRVVGATVLRNIGKAKPFDQDEVGQLFDPQVFLTRWNTYSPEARTALVESMGPMMGKDLDRLAKVASMQKAAYRVMPNPAGTASNTAFWGIMTAMAGGLTSGTAAALGGGSVTVGLSAAAPTILAGVGANLTARAFTNPRIVHWMVGQTKVPYSALGMQLGILAKDSQKWDPESRDAAQELLGMFRGVTHQQMMLFDIRQRQSLQAGSAADTAAAGTPIYDPTTGQYAR